MSDIWLLADSFEHGHRLIEAVNVLSIHTKLLLAGNTDNARTDEAEKARLQLREFLTNLEKLVPEVEADNEAPLPGQAPRSGDFVRRFVAARRQDSVSSPLLALPLPDFMRLLDSSDEGGRRELVSGLTKLREMLEQHHHVDVNRMLGQL